MTLYALLVGIDAYKPPVNALYGCRADIAALQEYLEARAGTDVALATLFDEQATRAAVVDTFRTHLGQAGAGDVALFAYAGHGSEEPAPTEIAELEPTGRIQTIVLYDCGRRVGRTLIRALADKELAVLLAGLSPDAHVALVLDCCHSGGGDRDPYTLVRGWRGTAADQDDAAARDVVAAVTTARTVDEFELGTLEQWRAPSPRHVALAACRSSETAKEHRIGDATRGAFSAALIEALDVLGPRATYRSLLHAVRSRVERTTREQRPEVFPLDAGSAADGLFLDGAVTPAPVHYAMTWAGAGWQIDAGQVHGLRPAVGDDAFVLACTRDGAVAGAVRVDTVDVATAVVVPVDWSPDEAAVYDAVVVDVPLPPAEVACDPPVDGLTDANATVVAAITATIATSGPGGQPSPYVHVVAPDDAPAPGAVRLRVTVPSAGSVVIAGADGVALTAPADAADAPGIVARLEHIARWEQVRLLGDHPSPLHSAVSVHAYPADPAETARPAERAEIVAAGGIGLRYERTGDDWANPWIYLGVRNETDETLHVAVLDLTDRFACRVLMHATELAGGHEYALHDGRPLDVKLPPGREVAPGAVVRDWLKVIVSDVPFDASAFDLDPLADAAGQRGTWSASTRASGRVLGTLERIAARAVSRDIGDSTAATSAPARWAATTTTLETVVPTS